MKPRWIVPLFAALLIGVVAFTLTRYAVYRRSQPPNCLQDLSFVSQALNLTETQQRQIRALHTTLNARLNDCCARHCAARARLGQALCSSTNDAETEALLAEMCRAYEASERATLENIRRVYQLLDAPQKQRFASLVNRCFCPCENTGNCSSDAPDGSRGGPASHHHGGSKPDNSP